MPDRDTAPPTKVASRLMSPPWVIGWLETPSGKVPRVSTKLKAGDILGFWRMRWRIGRMNYKVEPGLYAVGTPDSYSPVLVSANYKMSFDILRRAMAGRDAWILVIDTRGINVWCAAGKGTFSAEEILHRLESSGLRPILSWGVIVLPQLSATGVRAYELQKRSGLRVIYGPVRARDLPAFLDSGMKATPEMRRVKFGFIDRLVLTPAEFVWSLKHSALLLALLLILGSINRVAFSSAHPWSMSISGAVAIMGAVLMGTVITPLLLPWIPGRAFSLKGCQVGFAWALAFIAYRWQSLKPDGYPDIRETIALLLLLPAISAYFALNFTGTSTFTSPSGVRQEVRFALPAIVGSAMVGAVVFAVGLFTAQI